MSAYATSSCGEVILDKAAFAFVGCLPASLGVRGGGLAGDWMAASLCGASSTAVHLLRERETREVVELLCAERADLSASDKNGFGFRAPSDRN